MRTMPRADPSAVVAFVAVVAHGSFRGAARALAVPKSTVSQRVAGLEAQLGARLLARTTRSVTLTDIGARYHAAVAPAVLALGAAEGDVSALRAHPSGRLRMTAPVELGQVVLGDVLGVYAQRYPDVQVEVALDDRQVSLVDEGFDLAVRVGPLPESSLVARKLGAPQAVGYFASPEYLARAGAPARPRDLAAHRCLVMSGSQSATSWAFAAGKRTTVVAIEPWIAVNSFAVLCALVRAGVGVARLPAMYIGDAVARGEVVELFERYRVLRQTFVVHAGGAHVAPALRAMVEVLVERFELAPWGSRP